MKVIKPQLLSLLYRPYLLLSQWRLSVTALCGFTLTSPRRLIGEQALWPILAEVTGGFWDEGLPKFRGEMLVFGTCYAPGGRAQPTVAVHAQVGPLSKRLGVIGDRAWTFGGFSEPHPFTQMPLDWEHAFGGPGFADNPKGKGMEEVTDEAGNRVTPLPNVEQPGRLMRSRGERPEPASFRPIEVTWPQRAKNAGTYGAKYLERDFPGMPPDIEPDFFQLAPADQWLDGYWKGDEKYLFENLHPTLPRIEGALPGIRARAFALRAAALEEIELRLETLVLAPDRDLGVLVFRGALPIAEDDATDIEGLFAACEDEMRPPAHYERAFTRRLDKDEGLLATLDDTELVPSFAATPAPEIPFPTAAEIEAAREKIVAPVREELAKKGVQVELPPPPPMPANLDELDAWQERMTAEADAKLAALQAEAEELAKTRRPPAAGPPKPLADSLLPTLGDHATPDLVAKLRALDAEAMDLYRQSAHHLQPAPMASPEVASARRKEVLDRHSAGATLAESDLTGCDLSAVQLQGVNLSRALLSSAKLVDADLSSAALAEAVFAHADLEGANLDGCDAASANFGRARLERTRFERALLRGAAFDDARIRGVSFRYADLREASLLGATIESTNFEGASAPDLTLQKLDLRTCRFALAQLNKSNFLEVQLDGVDFAGADLSLVTFLTVTANGANFTRARLRSLHAVMGCSFAGANFEGADLEGAFLRGCNLEGANFEGARLEGADLSECNLRGARLSRSQAKEALFVRADLQDASVHQADLMQAMLQKATLHGADLSGSNLFGANLGQIRLDPKTRLTGCNLKRVLIHPKAQKP